MTDKYQVRPGGLMRCCLATLQDRMASCAPDPTEGEVIHCKFHDDNGGMVFREGAWEWNRPPMPWDK